MTQTIIEWLNEKGRDVLQFLWLVVLALLLIWIGRMVIKLISKGLKKIFARSKMEPGVAGFLLRLCQVAMYLLLAMGVTDVVGIGASSVIAVVGSAGVAIGLALQGSLSNLAGGVLLLATQPFLSGDFIISGGESGTVSKIDLFYTTLLTPDGRQVVIPNGTLAGSVIQNVSKMSERRIDLMISVAYEADTEEVKRVLTETAGKDPAVLRDKEILAYVNSLGESGVEMGLRFWVKREDFWTATVRMREAVKATICAAGIEIPYNKLDVTVKSADVPKETTSSARNA